MSARIKISPAYLSDLENNRRYPMDSEKIAILVKELQLSPEEQKTLYELAGRELHEGSLELPEYTMDSEVTRYIRYERKARKAREIGATFGDRSPIAREFNRKGEE